jgi:hypothetical protein
MSEEIWKDIPEFKGYYQASSMGRIRRIGDCSNQNASWELKSPRILKPKDNGKGYSVVTISIDGVHYYRYIHRLVAQTFIDNPNNYKEINHKDGNKRNNCVDSIEWCDRSYNNKHAYAKGLRSVQGCYGKKKKVAMIDMKTNRILHIFEYVDEASKYVGLKNFTNISACCSYAEDNSRYQKPYRSSKGYKWRFATSSMRIGDIVSN